MIHDPFGVCLEPKCDEEQQPELPSFKEMAKGFVGTAKDILTGAFQGEDVLVSEEVYNTRIDICNNCEFFRKRDQRCSQCGCFMEAKTRFKKSRCPIHKWESS